MTMNDQYSGSTQHAEDILDMIRKRRGKKITLSDKDHNWYDDVVTLWNMHSDAERTFKSLKMTAEESYELNYALTRKWIPRFYRNDNTERAEEALSMIKMSKGRMNPALSSLLDLLDRRC